MASNIRPMPAASRSALIVALAGMVLFLSVGIRQGFGLFLIPIVDGGTLSRANFSLAVALQYLLWGCIGPVAAKLALRHGNETILALGGALYALGFFGASLSISPLQFILCTGVLIGAGLGFANYGVVNGLVSMSVDPSCRGRALGVVGSLTALGQLLLLLFTNWTLGLFQDWRTTFVAHACMVALIVPIALVLRRMATSTHEVSRNQDNATAPAGSLRDLLLVCIGFGFSGCQVMFTMTHLPAILKLQGSPAGAGTLMLVILSASSFFGSYAMGYASDLMDRRRLLGCIYVARALCAAAFLVLPGETWALAVYFLVLGFVWMSTFPVITGLTSELFGAQNLALKFSYVFLAHQIGGFTGTWLGGIIAQQTGSYALMFPLICAGCLVAAGLTTLIGRGTALPIQPQAGQ